ncbi:MAG: AzlC family ABC transporter permease, partial [Actinomycetota bacterium]
MTSSTPNASLLPAPTPAPARVDKAASRLRWAATEGLRDVTPMVVGVAPFGLAIGAAISTTSLSLGQGLVSGVAILAGASQLTVITMLDDGVAPLVIILSALIVNVRILLYSAALAPWFRDEPLRRRLILAIPVIDQMYFTCVPRFERCDLDRGERRAYYLAAGGFLIVGFLSTQAVAIVAGAQLPTWTGIGVMAPLALAGLLAKSVADGRAVRAAAAAAVVAVIGAGLPF